ncbi:10596_t:CDS:1 [Paraglomus occultum]|uniref:10596_t:CDS:1 n=1 Tax=Paraglomus occultum TaxID=144539 RepID=A0A9N9A8Z1_9GLOM|nr:10596_t:CDS:1 [Paraglomus occultum]
MKPNYLTPEYKYLLNEIDVFYLRDSTLNVTEKTVNDEPRKMASIYFCGTLLLDFQIPTMPEAREMAKRCGWTKIVDDFSYFRCILAECLVDVQRKDVAKIALIAWKKASDETRKNFNFGIETFTRHDNYTTRSTTQTFENPISVTSTILNIDKSKQTAQLTQNIQITPSGINIYLTPEYKYLLNEMDVSYLRDFTLNVTERKVGDKSRKMASIYYCARKLFLEFPIPTMSEAREMAKQCGWTKIVDDFTFFRCILAECLVGVQRKDVAKMALIAWKRASNEARKSFDISR